MDNIQIKNEDTSRLIIDLLIRNSAEIASIKELLIMQAGANAPVQNRDTIVQQIQTGAVQRYQYHYKRLKEEIYKQYGHIDLEGL